MACPTGRCALRRFDGHGSGSYRPNNQALANENETRLANLLAARENLDSLFKKPDEQKEKVARLPESFLATSLTYDNFKSGILVPESKPISFDRGITASLMPESNPISFDRGITSSLMPESNPTGSTPWKTPSASFYKKNN